MPKINQTRPPRIVGKPHRELVGSVPGTRQSVLDRIRPIAFDDSDGIRMMVYGRSGTGKTTLWSTFPKPILAIIASGSSQPGELRSVDTPELRKVISTVTLQQSTEIRELVEHLRSNEEEVSTGFGTVVLDHVTGLQDMVLKEILGLDEIPIQKSWGLATQQQYGTCILRCKELLSSLLSVRANVVLVAQEKDFNTDSDGDLIAPAVGAALTPSLCGWANSVCDYIVNTFLRQHEEVKQKNVNGKTTQVRVKTRKVEYCLRTGPHPVYCTKFRLPKGNPLPESIVDPDYDKLMTIIRGQSAE
jgi:hypothetical protein